MNEVSVLKIPRISIFHYIRKYWYYIILAIIILPSIFHSIRIAQETKNPTYPLFDLATRLLTADQSIDKDVSLLQTEPIKIIGMEKPEGGIWLNTKYYWLFFWNFIFRTIGNIWLIFFPLIIIYKFVSTSDTTSPSKNMIKSFFYFLIYLFITNTVIFVYELGQGRLALNLPANIDKFKAYYLLFIKILPFHGIINLFRYLINQFVIT